MAQCSTIPLEHLSPCNLASSNRQTPVATGLMSGRIARLFPVKSRAVLLSVTLFLLLQLAGLYLFTRGFLLTRLAIEEKSHCNEPFARNATLLAGEDRVAHGCWTDRGFKRAVVVLIDALRFDFAAYDEAERRYASFHNRLPILHKTIRQHPTRAALFEFIADPPTTTLQRLKALTTGTLPTFVDAGSNFDGATITEDNWIAQAQAQGLRVWHMGDDTWGSIYPDSFARTDPFPSLDVWDLYTVDNGIQSLLPGAFNEQRNDWDVLVTHFLGVDHCGHRYSPNHPIMPTKLAEMNRMLENVMHWMDDDTVLLVFGDHGMDMNGDHGGDSDVEVQSALFVYSRRDIMPADRQQLHRALEQLQAEVPDDKSMRAFSDRPDLGRYRTVSQIDLVPTLSLLLGLPVPFSSLGMVIPELFLAATGEHPEHNTGSRLVEATRLNAQQVMRYVETYTSLQPSGELADKLLQGIVEKYHAAEEAYSEYIALRDDVGNKNTTKIEESAYRAYTAYARFFRTALSACRRIWAQFDTALMTAGIIILVAAAAGMVHVMLIPTLQIAAIVRWYRGALVGGAVTIVAQRIRLASRVADAIGLGTAQRLDQVILGSFVGFLLVFLWQGPGRRLLTSLSTLKNRLVRTLSLGSPLCQPFNCSLPGAETTFAFLALPVTQFAMFGANSYILYENGMMLALLQSYGLISLLQVMSAYHRNRTLGTRAEHSYAMKQWLYAIAAFLILGRVSSYTTVCRDERIPHCVDTFYTGSGSTFSDITLIQLVALAVIIPWLLRRLFIATDSFHGVARLWIDWGLRATLFLSAAYWILEESAAGGQSTSGSGGAASRSSIHDTGVPHIVDAANDWPILKRTLARLGFGMSLLVGLISWHAQPFCLNISEPSIADSKSATRSQAIAPTPRTRRILGIDNVYGAAYLVLVTVIYATLAQTQLPGGALTLAMGLLHILAFIEMLAAQRTVTGKATSNFCAAVVLQLLARHYFFATGHQANFVSLQWRVANIGLAGVNWYISPWLVIGNTLSAHILCAAAVPLLVLWRRSLHPSTGSSTNAHQESSVWPLLRGTSMAWSLVWTLLSIAVSFWCMHFRRHLMVWKVWAPRFMLAAVATLGSQIVLLLLALLFGVLHMERRLPQILPSARAKDVEEHVEETAIAAPCE